MIDKLEIGVHVTDLDTRNGLFEAMNIVKQFILGQIAAQEHFVADRDNIGMPGSGNLDGILKFQFRSSRDRSAARRRPWS